MTQSNNASSPTSNHAFETDVAIIGAGPVGLFSVFQMGMLGLKSHVVDALPDIGGQCTALYPEKPIYDIPAYPAVQAAALIEKLEAQASPFKPVYHLNQTVEQVAQETTAFKIVTSIGTEITAGAVIIAAGAGAFGPNRPPLENIKQFESTSVFYAVRNKAALAGKRVVIAGGGDSAVDWALALVGVAAKISVVHRRDQFRAAPENVAQLKKHAGDGTLDLVVPYQLHALEGEGTKLQRVIVAHTDGHKKTLEADVLLPFFGLATSLGPIANWGLAQTKNHISVNQTNAETSVPGIYAVGDVATYPHKLKLILTGFAEAAQAAHAIYARLNPHKPLHMEYSTTKGVPA